MLLSPIGAERLVSELFSRFFHPGVDSNRDGQAETWDKLVYLGCYSISALTFSQRTQ